MEIDPRKKYALKHKEHCDKLPDYIKIHIPKCKKEIKDYAIKHHEKPKPLPPQPPPQPPPPDPPPWWKAPLDIDYYEHPANYALSGAMTGIGAAMTARNIDRRLNRRARAPRGRIAPEEGERGSSRRRLRARIAPAEEERPMIRAELAPPEIDEPEDVAGADDRLSTGIGRALEAGDRAAAAARTIPMTSHTGSFVDTRNLPRANVPHSFRPDVPSQTTRAPRPQRMIRADPRLEDEFGDAPDIEDPDFEMPDIPDDTGDADPRRLRVMRSGQSMLPRAFQPEARVSRGAPRGALRPQVGGQSARTGISDVHSNPSVRPTPQRQQQTQRRKLRFREEVEGAEPTEHPSETQITEGGSGAGPSRIDPMEQIVLDDEERARQEAQPRSNKGKEKVRAPTRADGKERVSTRLEDTLRGRRTTRGLQIAREGGSGVMERHSFMTGADHDLAPRGSGLSTIPHSIEDRIPPVSASDDMLDEIGRLQNRTSRGSIRGTDDPAQVVRGRGLGEAQTWQDREPTEISPDQGLGDVPDDFEPLEDVPLLTTPGEPGRPPRISNISRVKRALQGVRPTEMLSRLSTKINSIGVPELQGTTTTAPSQAATELQSAQTSLTDRNADIARTRADIANTQSKMAQERTTIADEPSEITADQSALTAADTADNTEISRINQAVSAIGTAEDGGFMASFAENLDGGIGVSASVAERLGLFGEKLAASTAGRAVGTALKVVGTPIRMVQAVGDAAGGVLRQGAVKLGTKVGGEVGARVAMMGARATGLVASGVGIISGGGELDPVQDAVGAALLLAVPMQMLGSYVRHQAEGQTEYEGIKGATRAGMNTDLWLHFNETSEKAIKKLMKGVPMDAKNSKGKTDWWKPATIKAHSQTAYEENQMMGDYNMAAINYANKKGNEPVYYHDKTTKKSGFVVPLNDTQLKNAIATYQKNPAAFADFDPMQLEIMGLNPQMAKGAAGATKVGNIYIPSVQATGKKGATTGLNQLYASDKVSTEDGRRKDTYTLPSTTSTNYSNAFLAWHKIDNLPSGQTNYFDETSPPSISPSDYISDVQSVINGMTAGSASQKYMENQLAWYKYYNVAGSPKPSTKLSPPTDAAQAKKLQDAKNDLANAQNELQFNITWLGSDKEIISNDQAAAQKLQTQINQLQGQPQTTTTTTSTQQQLQTYQDQANAYNLQVAQQVANTEQQMMASTGLTAQDYQGLTKVLQQQITAKGVTTYTQNQLANLPSAGSQQISSSQGATSQTLTSGQGSTGQTSTTTSTTSGTGVNTRATTSPSGNSGSLNQTNPASGAVQVPSSTSGTAPSSTAMGILGALLP